MPLYFFMLLYVNQSPSKMPRTRQQSPSSSSTSILGSDYDETTVDTPPSSPSTPSMPPLAPPRLKRETTYDYMTPLTLPPRPNFEEGELAQGPISPTKMCTELEKDCLFCKKAFYTDQEFKTACPDCYDTHRRRCVCGRNLPIDAPKYKVQCTKCWIEARKETHEVCPSCTGARALHLRKRKDKDMCLDCARSKQRDSNTRTHRKSVKDHKYSRRK